MSRTTTKSILSRNEISLIKNSEEAKNTDLYGNLFEILLQIKDLKAITKKQLEDLNLNSDGLSALTHNKQTLIENTTKEWKATTEIVDNPQKNKKCQLCNTSIRYECHIRNILNNKELTIGSECVNEFKLDGYIEQKKQLSQIRKGHKIVARRNEFYTKFPGCEQFISNTQKYFSTLPILLPYDLYTKFQDTIVRMRNIYTKYVNEGKKPFESPMDSFELFQLALDQIDELKSKAEMHIVNNNEKSLICKRREIDWMVSNNKNNLLRQISENNGHYNLTTLKQMSSYEFINEYINDIVNRNRSQLFQFIKITYNEVHISFNKKGYFPPIIFKMKLENFMSEIGANCIINKNFIYNINDMFSMLSISNSKNNLESVINYILEFMHNFNCALLFDDETNNIILCRRGDKAIRIFNPQQFLISYSKHITKSDDDIRNFLFSLVKGNNSVKWVSAEIQTKQGIDNKINRLYKEQYLDIKDQFVQYNYNKYVEIISYKTTKNLSGNMIIDFNHPEFINIPRGQIRLSNNTLKYIDYAIYISEKIFTYEPGTILFVQNSKKVKNENIIFYISSDAFVIKECHTIDEHENIFKHIDVEKRNLQSYGKIIYSLSSKQ